MQKLLKFLDDDHYVSTYNVGKDKKIVGKDKKIVRGLFWAHLDLMKLFDKFFYYADN